MMEGEWKGPREAVLRGQVEWMGGGQAGAVSRRLVKAPVSPLTLLKTHGPSVMCWSEHA